MARITRDGRTWHPDELRAGADLEDGPVAESPAQLEAAQLEAAGYAPDPAPSAWWTAPDGSRHQGRAAALRHLAG